MKKRLNQLNFKSLDALKRYLQEAFPNLCVAFYLKKLSGFSLGENELSYHVFEVDGDNLVWRTYRKSDTPLKNDWDVDQIDSVNKLVRVTPNKGDISDHHIIGEPEENIMKRNQLTFEVIEDQDGNFSLNKQKDGLVPAFINFETPPWR